MITIVVDTVQVKLKAGISVLGDGLKSKIRSRNRRLEILHQQFLNRIFVQDLGGEGQRKGGAVN